MTTTSKVNCDCAGCTAARLQKVRNSSLQELHALFYGAPKLDVVDELIAGLKLARSKEHGVCLKPTLNIIVSSTVSKHLGCLWLGTEEKLLVEKVVSRYLEQIGTCYRSELGEPPPWNLVFYPGTQINNIISAVEKFRALCVEVPKRKTYLLDF